MAISELCNAPVEMTVAGRQWKIQRSSIAEIWGMAERAVVQDYYKSVQELAASMPESARRAYYKDVMGLVPRGRELEEARTAYLNSTDGVAELILTAFRKHYPSVTHQDVIDMIVKDPTGIELVVAYVVGADDDKPSASDAKKN